MLRSVNLFSSLQLQLESLSIRRSPFRICSSNTGETVAVATSVLSKSASTHPTTVPAYWDSRRSHNFQNKWFKEYPWLHYDLQRKGVLCFVCIRAKQSGVIPSCIKMEPEFVSEGMSNWKKGTARFQFHEQSQYHKAAVSALLSLSKATPVSAQLSAAEARQQAEARVALKKKISTIKTVAKQGIAVRGKDINSGIFMEFLKMRAEDVPELDRWLKRKTKFLSAEIQNEMLEIMAHMILRDIVKEIKICGKFSNIMDESMDISNIEQVIICLRSVAMEHLEPIEYFIGFNATASTTGKSLTDILQDSLTRIELDFSGLRGQCYDGGSAMKGQYKGVQARIKEIQPLAIYVHCTNHSLNFGVQDSLKNLPAAREALLWAHDVGVIIKASPKRKALFETIREEFEEGFSAPKTICTTRWTVRKAAINGLLNCYRSVLALLLDLAEQKNVETIADGKKINISAKARGLHDQLEKSKVYFALLCLRDVLTHCESLSKVLQTSTLSLSGAKEAIDLTLQALRRMRSDEHFEKLWRETSTAESLNLVAPSLPRTRRPPLRNEYNPNQTSDPHVFSTPKDAMRKDFFEIVDVTINEIEERFEQEGFRTYFLLEKALLTPPQEWKKEDGIEELIERYGINVQKLKGNLESLPNIAPGYKSLCDIAEAFGALQPEARKLFPALEELIVLLLVIPPSAATGERGFNVMRRLKDYLRSTTGQARFNHLAILYIYKERTEKLDERELMRAFVNNDYRHSVFGSIK